MAKKVVKAVVIQPAEILDRVDALVQSIQTEYTELARLLWQVRDEKLFAHMGYEDFESYCSDRLHMQQRKGHYLASIHQNLVVEAGVDPVKLAEIDWSLAREVASLPPYVLEDGGANKWLTKAKTMTYLDLLKEIKVIKKADRDRDRGSPPEGKEDGAPVREETTKMHFAFFPAQLKNVEKALEVAAAKANSDKKSHLLDCICLEFLVGNMTDKDVTLETILHSVERVFEVQCVAVKARGIEEAIVFGQAVAAELGIGSAETSEPEGDEAEAEMADAEG